MKKLLLVLLAITLIAAGCNKTTTKQNLPVAQNETPQNQQFNLLTPEKPIVAWIQGEKPFIQVNWNYEIANSFNVYRSTSATDGWQKIISDFPASAHTAVDYDYPRDASVLYYRITSLDNNGSESIPSQAASVTITTPQSLNTSGWKTAYNKTLGFSIKYPSDWRANLNSDTTFTFGPSGGQDAEVIVQFIKKFSDKQDIPDIPLLKPPHTTTDGEQVNINGITWTKWVVDNNQAAYETSKDQIDYVVQFATIGNYVGQSSQILYSFTFTK